MADFSALKTSIQNYIKQNGNNEITGAILQQILLSMVTALGDNAINDLVSALGDEVTARQHADGTLQDNIDDEATARSQADDTLQQNINSEASTREQANNTLRNSINSIIANIENGYVYAGIATPSTTPATGKVFYLALTAGTYTNFGTTVVPQGINVLKYNGSAWSLDSFLGLDDVPTQGSNNLVKSGGVLESIIKDGSAFDLSAYNSGTTYADLSAALTALNALPAAYKKGGMSVKFVRTSDNNSVQYVQYRLMKNQWSTDVSDWQGVDENPTAGSKNLVESGGVYAQVGEYIEEYTNYPFSEGAYIDATTGAETSYWNGTCTDYIAAELGDTFELLSTEDYIQQLVIYGYDSSKQPVKLLGNLTASIGDSDIAYVRAGSTNKSIISGFRKKNNKSIDNIYSDISALFGEIIEDLGYGSGTSGYISNDSIVVTPYTGYEYKEYSVTADSRISLFSYLIRNMCAIAKKNSDGTYTPLVQSDDSTTYKLYMYTYTCTENCTIVVSYGNSSSPSGQIKIETDAIAGLQEDVEKIDNKINNELYYSASDDFSSGCVEGKYLAGNGTEVTSSFSAYKVFENIQAGTKIKCTVYTHPNVPVILFMETYETKWNPVVNTSVGYRVETWEYIATKDGKVAINLYHTNSSDIAIFNCNYIKSNRKNIENILAKENLDDNNFFVQNIEYGFMFDKIAVIGDSLASGRVEGIVGQPDAVGADYLSFSWLQLLAKRWRCSTALNYSNAGATTASWISTWLPVMQADPTVCDIYFIALGTNNEYNESNPSGDQERYEAFIDRYNEIIDAVRTKAPNAAIILMSLYEKREGNTALEEIAEERMQTDDGIYYLDYANNAKYLRYSPETNWRGHFSSTGYVYAASAINQILNDIIWENKTKEFWQQFAKNHNYVQPIPTT